ncbi:LANO_0H06326g1_1 [Lachancea nothofagi CBS 11611]|uniref:LANO_0H06326g1_1 n=1 Tax=Lachancea nothofagi CBS 11611 TaxID=1266666 RepID=A0A1G4KLE7_9SACH|nr:LANO_0H06326g1_1 [Lachancea nothofagi CBS 11611]
MEANATRFSSTINLVKTIVGAGMLAIPYAFKSDGILVGSILTLMAALTSGFGLFVLAKSSKTLKDPRSSSFFTLCSITYPNLSLIFDLSMFVQCYGVGLSYLILIGDLFPGLVGGSRRGWIIGSAVAIVPLLLLKKLDSLKYSSILALFAVAYLVCLILGFFVSDVLLTDNSSVIRGDISWIRVYDLKGLVSTFTIIIFAFTGSMNLFSIINELKDNSMSNIDKVISRTMFISSVLFLIVGICGYLTFGSNVMGNIMLNYDPESNWTIAGKLCMGFMVVLSFPLLFHPCRISANNMVHWINITYGKCEDHHIPRNEHTHPTSPISMVVEDEEDRLILGMENGYQSTACPTSEHDLEVNRVARPTESVPFSNKSFYIITAVLVSSLYVLALKVTSFALVLGIVGATGSTSISFTLPGLFGYKLIGSEAAKNGRLMSKSDRFYKYCSLLLTIYGLFIMCLCLYVTCYFGA